MKTSPDRVLYLARVLAKKLKENLNLTQKAKELAAVPDGPGEPKANTALLDGVRRLALEVKELDIDLIERINPF
jgi:hypothetical protein